MRFTQQMKAALDLELDLILLELQELENQFEKEIPEHQSDTETQSGPCGYIVSDF